MEEGKGFKTAKKKFSQGSFHLTCILEANGKNITNQDRIVEQTREFDKEAYSSNQHQDKHAVNSKAKSDTEEFPLLLARKVEDAIQKRQNTSTRLHRTRSQRRWQDNSQLASLFTTCLKQNKIPDGWNDAIIVLLHKR